MRLLLCLLLLGASTTHIMPALAAFDMGPLNPFLEEGVQGPWRAADVDGALQVENRTDARDVRYVFVNTPSGTEGRREIGLEVSFVGGSGDARAGLLYGFQRDPKSYFMFTVGGDRKVRLHQMTNGRFEERVSLGIGSLDLQKVSLGIREAGKRIALLVDGVEKSSIENDSTGRGGVGIVAAGIGAWRLSGFDVAVDGGGRKPESGQPTRGEPPSGARPLPRAQVPSGAQMPNVPTDPAANPARVDAGRAIVYRQVIDPDFRLVRMRIPMPANWNLGSRPGEAFIRSDDGVEILPTRGFTYVDAAPSDTRAVDWARRQGMNVAPLVPLEQFVSQVWQPPAERHGFALTRSYPLPQLADFWTRMTHGTQMAAFQNDAIGTEWQGPNGRAAFVTFVRSVVRKPDFTSWVVQATELYAPAARVEQAKRTYLYAIENTQFNPQWQRAEALKRQGQIEQSRAYWAGLAAQSKAAHDQRMAAISAAGNASTSIAKTNSDTLDISHAGYLKRSNMVSAGQAKSVQATRGTNIIASAATGERYEVEAKSQYYWVDNRGEYFGTDNPLIDPRIDQRVNDREWTQFDIER